MSQDDGDLDALVRRVDADRWLASRFVPDAGARADVIALYAFNYELSRAAEVASQPLVGEMRLAWWREALDEIFEGRPVRRHPAAPALDQAVRRRGLERAGLEALIDGRLRELDPWPLGQDEAEDYMDATSGALMTVAAQILAPGTQADLRGAGRAWALAGLHRRGDRLPEAWDAGEVRRRTAKALAEANRNMPSLPVSAFPAVAYAALSGPYAADGAPSELSKRVRLTWAVAWGRI